MDRTNSTRIPPTVFLNGGNGLFSDVGGEAPPDSRRDAGAARGAFIILGFGGPAHSHC